MQQYKIGPDGLEALRKKSIARSLPVILIAAIGGVSTAYLNSKDEKFDIVPLLITIVLLGVVLTFSLTRGLKRLRNLLETYTVTITENAIRREQVNTPTIYIPFSEIKEINRQPNGNIFIKGARATDIICVFAEIDNREQLEQSLAQIKPISDKTSFLRKYSILYGVLVVGMMLCVYALKDKAIVGTLGVILTAILVWSFIKGLQSKNMDARSKRGIWWVLLVLVSVVVITVMKLMAP